MAGFEWDEYSHIDWFTKRFKGESNIITAATVQQNYHRKKGEPKLCSQDYKNLMRLVVQRGLARVSNGFVTSKDYSIRMVSESYPYVQEIFPVALITSLSFAQNIMPDENMLKALFPEVENWGNHGEALRHAVARTETLGRAFNAWNYSGGDLSDIFVDDADFLTEGLRKYIDLIYLTVEGYAMQYKAFKIASPELTPYREFDTFQFCKMEDYLISKVVQSGIIYEIWRLVGKPGEIHIKTLSKWKIPEMMSELLEPGSVYPEVPASTYSPAFEEARFFHGLVCDLPSITDRSEVVKAVEECKKIHRRACYIERSLFKERLSVNKAGK